MQKTKKPTKKEEQELKDFIMNHVQMIKSCARLSHFKCENFYWIDTKKAHNKGVQMQVTVDYKYLQFSFGVNKEVNIQLFRDKQYYTIVSVICHEVCHLLTLEYEQNLKFKSPYKEREYYNERLTEHMSRWLDEVYDNYMYMFKINIKTGKIKK